MRKGRNNAGEEPSSRAAWNQCFCGGSGPRLTLLMGGACRGPVFEHFRNAGVEMLKGFRAILDQQIEMWSGKERKGTRVPVE